MQAFQTRLQRVHQSVGTHKCGVALLGGTAILLRQVFADKGQAVVGSIAVSSAVAGRTWDTSAIKRLHEDLVNMDPRGTPKRKGFMSAWSGPKWIGKLIEVRNMIRFNNAPQLVGEFMTSAVAEASTFHDICSTLKKGDAKLYGIAE